MLAVLLLLIGLVCPQESKIISRPACDLYEPMVLVAVHSVRSTGIRKFCKVVHLDLDSFL